MNFDADLIIMGGGPAGSASAIFAALSGKRVILIEKEEFPRPRPGESLHPGVEIILNQLGVMEQVLNANFIRHTGYYVDWGKTKRFTLFGQDASGLPWQGFQAWRERFDSILLDRAKDLGTEVINERVKNLLIKDGRVTGIVTDKRIRNSRYIIDATGRRQWLRNSLNLKLNQVSPFLIAYYGYCEGEDTAFSEDPLLTADGSGWTWIAKVKPDLYQWVKLRFDRKKEKRELIPESLKNFTPKGNIYGADVSWRSVLKPAGPGYFIVGDAATILDPAASNGILKALMSGIMAAYQIEAVDKKIITEQKAIMTYRNWLLSWFEKDVIRLTSFYKQVFKEFNAC